MAGDDDDKMDEEESHILAFLILDSILALIFISIDAPSLLLFIHLRPSMMTTTKANSGGG